MPAATRLPSPAQPFGAARRRGRLSARSLGLALVAVIVAACGSSAAGAGPSPAAFNAIVAALHSQGISVTSVVSGDAGCSDRTLMPAAISFQAAGLDQTSPVQLYLYRFGDGAAYNRLRGQVEACARSYAGGQAAGVAVDLSPYVLAGPGPWGSKFKAALRSGLQLAASPQFGGQ